MIKNSSYSKDDFLALNLVMSICATSVCYINTQQFSNNILSFFSYTNMYHYSNMQHYPAEWQNYRFPPQDAYNDYYDPYYSTVYGTSSFNKHRKDKKNRHTSVSQGKLNIS